MNSVLIKLHETYHLIFVLNSNSNDILNKTILLINA